LIVLLKDDKLVKSAMEGGKLFQITSKGRRKVDDGQIKFNLLAYYRDHDEQTAISDESLLERRILQEYRSYECMSAYTFSRRCVYATSDRATSADSSDTSPATGVLQSYSSCLSDQWSAAALAVFLAAATMTRCRAAVAPS